MTGLARLLDELGRDPDERLSVCTLTPAFTPRLTTVAEAPGLIDPDGDCWYGAAPLHPRVTTGKGYARDVVGIREIYADLDVKDGGLPDYPAATAVIADMTAMLGAAPVAVVGSGHGLQPHWAVERDDDTDWPHETDPRWRTAQTLLRRWGRLVAHVAEQHGGATDSVFNLDRILRTPGTTNRKDPAAPRKVTVGWLGGAPVSLSRLAETLDEYGVPEMAEDGEQLGEQVSAPSSWTYAEGTCGYVAGMVAGWPTDTPPGRHPWLVAQAVRLAAAHRLGCITEADRAAARKTLAARFRELLKAGPARQTSVGVAREETPGEIAQAFAWGTARCAAFTDERARKELGEHPHEPPEGSDPTDLLGEKTPKAEGEAKPKGKVRDDTLSPPSDPMAVARALLPDWQLDELLTLRHWRGGWMQWKQTHWDEVEDAEIRSTIYRRVERAFYWVPDGKGGFDLKKWAPTRPKVGNLMEAVAACTHLANGTNPPEWLDDEWSADRSAMGPSESEVSSQVRGGGPHGPRTTRKPQEIVACANGLLWIGPDGLQNNNGLDRGPSRTSRKLLDLTPRFFNRVAVPFDWDPAAAAPARWLGFLGQLWPEDADSVFALQEFFGYVLSGRTDLHKIMLLIGPTRSGKGTIARVLGELVGRGNVAGPTLASLGTNFGLSPLLGKPLAVVSDARLGGANVHQVVERLLSVSGEDTLTVDRKYREPWTGKIGARFLLLSNELPRLGDASGAIANRFVVLTMHQSFLGKENTRLTAELTEELPGILGWALDGLDRLIERRSFTEPASSGDAIRTLQDLVSPMAVFVRDRCEVGAGLEVTVAALFTEWKDWCDLNGHKPGSVQTLGRDLRAVAPHVQGARPREGDTRERGYVGIALRTSTASKGDDWIGEYAKKMAG